MPESRITFNRADRDIPVRQRTYLKEFITALFGNEKTPLQSLSYVFCSDKFLLKINQEYLNHDDYTDIITFDLSEGKEAVGEIYISVDRVKENAGKFNNPFSREILRVIFHGALHLCGYKDKTPQQTKLMRQKEEYYLNKWTKQLRN